MNNAAVQNPISQFTDLVFEYTNARFTDVKDRNLKMAHYTTADTAMLILKNRSLWLRNASMMNDFSEIQHGNRCLDQSLKAGLGNRLAAALNSVHPGIFHAIATAITSRDWQTRSHTYLISLSEHEPVDNLGKLSMWRAYGGPKSGVAIVLNTEPFWHDSDKLGAYSSPVLYGGVQEYTNELERVVRNIENNLDVLRQVPFDNAQAIMMNMLQHSTLTTKHPAFAEEREWRVTHAPLSDATAFIPTSIQTVGGIPQMVCEIPLQDQPGLNMPWLELDKLLHRIIIGPCVYPEQVAWAFREMLLSLGIANPDDRIAIADIPLRQHF